MRPTNETRSDSLEIAKKLIEKGDTEKSLFYIEKCASDSKNDAKTLIKCAELAEETNSFHEATKHYQSAINLKGNNIPLSWQVRLITSYISLAEQCIGKGENEKTKKILKIIENKIPDNTTTLVRYAKLLEQIGNFEEVCKALIKAINLKECAPAWWHVRLAHSYLRLGDLNAAIEQYKKAISLNPSQENWKTALNELTKKSKADGNPLQASKSYYDEIYEKSEKYNSSDENNIYVEMWLNIISHLKKENSKSILDVGCGPGQFAEFLLKRYKVNYTGLDFSETAIRKARKRNPEALFYQEDILQSNIMGKLNIDTIICTEVLEHIEEDIQVVEKFPQGKFTICSVPSFDAFGHVRTFPNTESVNNRYEKFFNNFRIEKFLLPTKQYMYLFTGIVK
ncbi:class I SAM-dependent methyltransferase [Halomonas sp. HL-93]|uniref:class I SAM-dependent methyltransferase n=1 Tax=Halomonas sp. HL-93 TaxID=1666906 RepID=UPI0007F163EC|nr:class I SAM-dependent methyltransferase [Halomonas sp. HL-93]SBR50240.1 Predicted methyltransferase, contains TPR repeat [Halomonas sp. HL-93]